MAQCVGTLTYIVFVFVIFYVFFKVVEKTMGNRVSAEDEIEGLDMPEMGALAYPDFVLGPGTPMGGDRAASGGNVRPARRALTPVRVELMTVLKLPVRIVPAHR